jgi:hypothetical protein
MSPAFDMLGGVAVKLYIYIRQVHDPNLGSDASCDFP